MMATEHTLLKCLSQHGYGASVAQAGSAEVAVLWRLSMSLQYLPLPFAHPLAHLPRNRNSQVPETASPLKSSLPPFYLHLAALHLRLPFRPPAPEPHSQVPEPASPSDSPPAAAHFARPPKRGHATAGPVTTRNETGGHACQRVSTRVPTLVHMSSPVLRRHTRQGSLHAKLSRWPPPWSHGKRVSGNAPGKRE